MASEIMSMLFTACSNVYAWFNALLSATGMSGVFSAVFFVFVIVRVLLVPLFGAAMNRGRNDAHEEGKRMTKSLEI